jgi:DNA sulfur modification protein DndD
MRHRFHDARLDRDCVIKVVMEFADFGKTQCVEVTRRWVAKVERICEEVSVTLDGVTLSDDEGGELLENIVPADILRFFFFDGEKIKELADWDRDDDSRLFVAVDQLLGLSIVDQLDRDLSRISDHGGAALGKKKLKEVLDKSEDLEREYEAAVSKAKELRSQLRGANRSYDEAKRRFALIGGLVASEKEELQRRLGEANARVLSLHEELSRQAHGILPLLLGRGMFDAMLEHVAVATRLERAEAVSKVLADSENALTVSFRKAGFCKEDARRILAIVRQELLPRPIALSRQPIQLSLRECAWMQSVLTDELPKLGSRIKDMVAEYKQLSHEIAALEKRLRKVPNSDPKAEGAFLELETSQRTLVECEAGVSSNETEVQRLKVEIEKARTETKRIRQEHFNRRRLARRDQILAALHEALPAYGRELRRSTEEKFAQLLTQALNQLWHKPGRVTRTEVDFQNRTLRLFAGAVEVVKSDLSSAEKQLFATGFIYALARLSNRSFPFVIDTPLGRLDRQHRRQFLNDFLGRLSHQVILFATDTEISRTSLRNLVPLIATQYELADFNGKVSMPVQLEVAL